MTKIYHKHISEPSTLYNFQTLDIWEIVDRGWVYPLSQRGRVRRSRPISTIFFLVLMTRLKIIVADVGNQVLPEYFAITNSVSVSVQLIVSRGISVFPTCPYTCHRRIHVPSYNGLHNWCWDMFHVSTPVFTENCFSTRVLGSAVYWLSELNW